jgi:hypothetical protein
MLPLNHIHEVRNGLTTGKIVTITLCWHRYGKGRGRLLLGNDGGSRLSG